MGFHTGRFRTEPEEPEEAEEASEEEEEASSTEGSLWKDLSKIGSGHFHWWYTWHGAQEDNARPPPHTKGRRREENKRCLKLKQGSHVVAL